MTFTSPSTVIGADGRPLHSDLPIGQYFENVVAEQGDRDFIVYPDRALRWSYKQFDERVDQLAKGLLAIGIGRGDHVGIWARNVPDWLTFMFATAKIGAVLVTVNPVYKSHELAYVMKQSDMKALCIIDAFRMRSLEGAELGRDALRRWLRRRGSQPASILKMSAVFPRTERVLRETLEILL